MIQTKDLSMKNHMLAKHQTTSSASNNQEKRNLIRYFSKTPKVMSLFGKTVTANETWVSQYDPETTCHSLKWKRPPSLPK
jgi:hypothetical protein